MIIILSTWCLKFELLETFGIKNENYWTDIWSRCPVWIRVNISSASSLYGLSCRWFSFMCSGSALFLWTWCSGAGAWRAFAQPPPEPAPLHSLLHVGERLLRSCESQGWMSRPLSDTDAQWFGAISSHVLLAPLSLDPHCGPPLPGPSSCITNQADGRRMSIWLRRGLPT